MKRGNLILLLMLAMAAGCKKKEVAAPAPVQETVAAPAAPVIPPGMEAENPAEKEGRP